MKIEEPLAQSILDIDSQSCMLDPPLTPPKCKTYSCPQSVCNKVMINARKESMLGLSHIEVTTIEILVCASLDDAAHAVATATAFVGNIKGVFPILVTFVVLVHLIVFIFD